MPRGDGRSRSISKVDAAQTRGCVSRTVRARLIALRADGASRDAPDVLRAVQGPTHVPFVQVWPDAQACPQEPQLTVLVVVSTHVPGDPQSICPATVQEQVPPWHAAPPVHA